MAGTTSKRASRVTNRKRRSGLRIAGDLHEMERAIVAGLTQAIANNYTYDDQGKLTLEAGPYATIAYTYDNVGNRLTRTVTNAALVQLLLTNGASVPLTI